jgi:CheY-like chemotaxis protein
MEPFTALIVDDDPFIMDIYSIKFTEHHHTIIPCSTPEEALKKLRTGTRPDIVISDLIMPFVDGFDFCKIVRDEHLADDIPLVVLSNQDDSRDFAKTSELKVTAHYIKIRSSPTETLKLIEGVVNHFRDPIKYPQIPKQW